MADETDRVQRRIGRILAVLGFDPELDADVITDDIRERLAVELEADDEELRLELVAKHIGDNIELSRQLLATRAQLVTAAEDARIYYELLIEATGESPVLQYISREIELRRERDEARVHRSELLEILRRRSD